MSGRALDVCCPYKAHFKVGDLFSDGDGNGLIYGASGQTGNPASPTVAIHPANTNLVTFAASPGVHHSATAAGLNEEELLKKLETACSSSEAISTGNFFVVVFWNGQAVGTPRNTFHFFFENESDRSVQLSIKPVHSTEITCFS